MNALGQSHVPVLVHSYVLCCNFAETEMIVLHVPDVFVVITSLSMRQFHFNYLPFSSASRCPSCLQQVKRRSALYMVKDSRFG